MIVNRAAVDRDVLRAGFRLITGKVDDQDFAAVLEAHVECFLDRRAATELMDSMIAAGVKPTEEIGGGGEVAYLRTVVDRLLLLTLPEGTS